MAEKQKVELRLCFTRATLCVERVCATATCLNKPNDFHLYYCTYIFPAVCGAQMWANGCDNVDIFGNRFID